LYFCWKVVSVDCPDLTGELEQEMNLFSQGGQEMRTFKRILIFAFIAMLTDVGGKSFDGPGALFHSHR
jgi:uncharacterized protein involved in tellurium resistance